MSSVPADASTAVATDARPLALPPPVLVRGADGGWGTSFVGVQMVVLTLSGAALLTDLTPE